MSTLSEDHKCRWIERTNQGQEFCPYFKGPCIYEWNQAMCEIPKYYLIPGGYCPNCKAYDKINIIKARLYGKDRCIGWICTECFYYIIFPLKPLKISMER